MEYSTYFVKTVLANKNGSRVYHIVACDAQAAIAEVYEMLAEGSVQSTEVLFSRHL